MKTEQYFWLGLGVIFSSFLLVILTFLVTLSLRISFEETIALLAVASILIIVGFIIIQLPRRRYPFRRTNITSHHK